MFTNADYREYFQAIEALERRMVYSIHDVISKINDDYVIRKLREVADDETKHYAYAKSIFDSVLFTSKMEKRKHRRRAELGEVTLEPVDGGGSINGKCADLSDGGLCVELEEPFEPGRRYWVSVGFFTGKRPVERFAEAVWTKEIGPGIYIGGLRFTKEE